MTWIIIKSIYHRVSNIKLPQEHMTAIIATETIHEDVLWAFGAGGNWTEVYDDILDGYFVMEGGQTVYFVVSNYYQGQTGTYLLEILIEKGTFGIEEFNDPDLVTLYPNPASGSITLNSINWNALTSPLEIEIVDMTGRSVYKSSEFKF